MPFATLLQTVTRAAILIVLLSSEMFGPIVVTSFPNNYWFYIAAMLLTAAIFVAISYIEDGQLVQDMRDLCLYEFLVYGIGLVCFLLGFKPASIVASLMISFILLKFGRLLWPVKSQGNKNYAAWPVFGVFGILARRNKSAIDVDQQPNANQSWQVYSFIVTALILGFILPFFDVLIPTWRIGVILFLVTPVVAKRVLTDMKYQHAAYLKSLDDAAAARELASVELARADAQHEFAADKVKSNQLLAAKNEELETKNTALAQAHVDITELLAERDKSKAEVEHLNRALLHAAHDMVQPLLLLRFAAIRLVEAEDEETRAVAKQELDQLHLNLADECNAAIYGAKVATKLAEPLVQAFSINAMLRELWFSWRDEAEQQGIDAFLMWPPGNPPLHVAGDPMLIGRVARNLILNAIMYAGKGSNILFSVRKRKTHALVQVWNSGAGIPGYDSPDGEANFAAFAQQMLEEGQRRGDGHGLGIDNVKHLSIAMGLRMTMQSRVGVGTVFGFRIPLAEYKLMAYT